MKKVNTKLYGIRNIKEIKKLDGSELFEVKIIVPRTVDKDHYEDEVVGVIDSKGNEIVEFDRRGIVFARGIDKDNFITGSRTPAYTEKGELYYYNLHKIINNKANVIIDKALFMEVFNNNKRAVHYNGLDTLIYDLEKSEVILVIPNATFDYVNDTTIKVRTANKEYLFNIVTLNKMTEMFEKISKFYSVKDKKVAKVTIISSSKYVKNITGEDSVQDKVEGSLVTYIDEDGAYLATVLDTLDNRFINLEGSSIERLKTQFLDRLNCVADNRERYYKKYSIN